jgi:uncharacterized protein (TIGR03435 family)
MVKSRVLWMAGVICIVGALAGGPSAQTPPSPAFEVASLKQNKSTDGRQRGFAPVGPGGRVTIVGLTVRELLRIAYSSDAALLPSQIVGGPEWVDSERFDITAIGGDQLASGPKSAAPGRLSAMLRTLIKDRFMLTAHTEQKEMPIYALIVERTDRLHQSLGECVPPGVAGALVAAQLCGFRRVGVNGMSGQGITMELLSGVLADLPDVRRVVRNRTNLTGRFDIDLAFSSMSPVADGDPTASRAPDSGPTLFTALREQLGLKLESTKGPVDVLVIDHVERPTPD